jgi:hypothetical protein
LSRITSPSVELRWITSASNPGRLIDAVGPSVVDALEGSDAEEPPLDVVAMGGDVSWNEQRARTMPKAAISGIMTIRLPTTTRLEL